MDVIDEKDCSSILKVDRPDETFKIVDFRFEKIKDHVEGFLSSSRQLVIRYTRGADRTLQEAAYFAKTLPISNEFHEKYVRSTRGFDKEVFFFLKIKPKLDAWCCEPCMPKCYLAVQDKVVILELLSAHRVKEISEYFDADEIESSVVSLASLHSASIACEAKNGSDPVALWGEYFFDALYLRKEGHLGFRHTTTGIRAIKTLIETKFPEIEDELKHKVYEIYDAIPEIVEPSKKFRNVISHGDLYTNNIMFCTGSVAPRAKLIDYQLFRFNPPALDLLMLIYLTTRVRSKKGLQQLTDRYYGQLRSNLKRFGLDVAAELPGEQFRQSLAHYKPAAIALSLLFQHYVNLPPPSLKAIMKDPSRLQRFLMEDRRETVLTAFELDAAYRTKLTTTLSMLFDSLMG